ncbi:glycosyltransferase family 4 protein [Azospira restricta]|uniref:Glycosyltransferase family 4 protein n=1 Tax=Azospira restricta TaxID=404405 RepID=A0A974SN32_9RHOO|nr:glycosyltransferase family 1 protein [Azospira restricta]QRJ63596.1 glycosyltransferase family 4 protein [Azospira restricta]
MRTAGHSAGEAILYDPRWSGQHGIGRFAHEIISRLPGARPLAINARRLSPIDPLAITAGLIGKRQCAYFSPGFNPPIAASIPFAFTIHDLIHLRFPGESSLLRRLYYRTVVKPGARRASCIFTVSEHAKADILDWVDLDEHKVVVVPNAPSDLFSPNGPRHESGSPYFLHVGRRARHKNIPRLVAAFSRVKMRDARLFFTGHPDPETEALIAMHKIGNRAGFTGPIDDSTLASLYRGALALVFPSLYEGFGLPVLEAMACGTPVITSTHPALMETAGSGNALFVPPESEEALTQAMDRMTEAAEGRAELRTRGIIRAGAFSWQDSATVVARELTQALQACQ